MSNETYTAAQVRDREIDLGDGWTISELQLKIDETAWNPLSSKGPLFGPAGVKYLMHRSGITVGMYEPMRCLGMNTIRRAGSDYYESVQCTEPVTGEATRCEDHKLC